MSISSDVCNIKLYSIRIPRTYDRGIMDTVVKWLESKKSTEKLTTNLYKILVKLAKRHSNDAVKFRKSCLALGKFKAGDLEFFKEFSEVLLDDTPNVVQPPINDDQLPQDSLRQERNPGGKADKEADMKPTLFKSMEKLRSAPELIGSDEEGSDELNITVISKREMNDEAGLPNLPLQIPKTVNTDVHGSESSDSDISIEQSELYEIDTDNDCDEQWYNYDDDYGNSVADDDILIENTTFNKAVPSNKRNIETAISDNTETTIQVVPISLSKRLEWIPPFLDSYSKKYNVDVEFLLGSFVESSHDDLINPFRNPESQFSINARMGSQVVALRRNQKDNAQKSKDSTKLIGTVLGDVLGVGDRKWSKDSNVSSNSKEEKNNKTNSNIEDIQKTRRSLPAYKAKSTLLEMIRDNQVCIVIGETGSGKTTQLSQYLYEAGFCSSDKSICCTQPRRVAAMSVAKRVSVEMGVKLGKEVGYSIRFEDRSSSETKIKFMTDGILLREFLLDQNLEHYSCIIIDEAHERSLNTDILLGLLKILLTKRLDLKVIITSATINAKKFSDFFGGIPTYTIPGKTFPVQVIHTTGTVPDYVEAAVSQAIRIHLTNDVSSGDILVFMTGQEDILTTIDLIKERLVELYGKKYGISTFEEIQDVELFPIYSALPAEIQNRIFLELDNGKRKIVVSTNIAETSLTISGIRYVIDCGYSKLKVYNPKIGLDSLAITPISLANANQRSGRAGRTAPGIAYRLYTDDTEMDDMYVQTIPEIQRTNLANTVLLLNSLSVRNVMEFPFMDPPPKQTLMSSLYELWFLGALDDSGRLSTIGKKMIKFPLQPSLCKALIKAVDLGCAAEILTIVAMLSVPQVFERPKERQEESDNARKKFFVPESDHLTLLNVYNQWKNTKYSSKWCSKNFLLHKSLLRAKDIRTQLHKLMKKNKFAIKSAGVDLVKVRKCICSGFAQQAARLSGLTKYVHLRTGIELKLHPTSALFGLGDLPPYVIYHELLMTEQEYICCVTSVDPFWLVEHGNLLYDIELLRNNTKINSMFVEVNDDNSEYDELIQEKITSLNRSRNERIKAIKATQICNANEPGLKQNPSQNSSQQQTKISSKLFKRRRPL